MSNYIILIVVGVFLLLRAVTPAIFKGQANASEERIREGLRQRIMQDPRNGANYHELARSYNKEGHLREALQVYQQLLPYAASVEKFEINQRIQDLERDIKMELATKFRPIGVDAPRLAHVTFCKACGSSNPQKARECWDCGQRLMPGSNPIDQFHDRWQDPRFRSAIGDTTVAVILTIGLLRVCYDASLELKIIAILLAFVLIAWQVWTKISGR